MAEQTWSFGALATTVQDDVAPPASIRPPIITAILPSPNLEGLLESGKYSDVTVVCGQDVYKLHKLIVCPQSGFFARACDGAFKESQSSEIDLSHDNPDAVKRMIRFLYTADFDDWDPSKDRLQPTGLSADTHPTLQTARSTHQNARKALYPEFRVPIRPRYRQKVLSQYQAKQTQKMTAQKTQVMLINDVAVYAIAAKYDVQPLKELARTKFKALLEPSGLPPDFAAVVELVLESTPESDGGLRDIISAKCSKQSKWICKDKSLSKALVERPELANDLLQGIMKAQTEQKDLVRQKLQSISSGLLSTFDQFLLYHWPAASAPAQAYSVPMTAYDKIREELKSTMKVLASLEDGLGLKPSLPRGRSQKKTEWEEWTRLRNMMQQ